VRVLLVQQSIDPPGGGNAVAAWMLQALHGVHEVSTLTIRPWDPHLVDQFFGTALAAADIEQRSVSSLTGIFPGAPNHLTRLRLALLFGAAQRLAPEFDLLVTAENYGAFGRRGLQYVHYPTALRPEPTRWPALVNVYYRLCDALSGLSWDTARRNETLANSHWTAEALRRDHGIAARVLYPPVVDPGPGRTWEARFDTFLCLGRFHGSKRLELVIDLVNRVRAWMPGARLHIVGSNVDRDYTQRLRHAAAPFHEWITIDEDLPRARIAALMSTYRYAVHAMEYEHFGMAVAEMARAGCIVFVHDSGGQVEAVGGAPELRWRTAGDAVLRIKRVVEDVELQRALSAQLRRHAAQFSTERFVREFREIVALHPAAMERNPGLRSRSS
jgi:glycosyltransferase involved in cell wall biosynthesis